MFKLHLFDHNLFPDAFTTFRSDVSGTKWSAELLSVFVR